MQEEMRIRHEGERPMLRGRSVAVHHEGAAEASLPVEEALVDPGPTGVGEGGPGRGEEGLLIGLAVQPAVNEQRVADTQMGRVG